MKLSRSLPFETGRAEIRRAKTDGDATSITLRGYAAKFNVLSEPMWGFQEQIAAGAFDGVLNDDVRALFNHDPNLILGRTASNTVRLSVDDVGLVYEVDLPDVAYARDLAASIERGDVSQSSFAFWVAPNGDRWDERSDGMWIRTITKLERLYDVSPVTYPAYPDATVGVRNQLDAFAEAKAAKEAAQREAGAVSRRRQLRMISA